MLYYAVNAIRRIICSSEEGSSELGQSHHGLYIGQAVKAGGGLISHTLGISAYPAEQVVQLYDQRCQVTLPAIMLEAEGDVIEAAAAPAAAAALAA